MCRTCHVVCIVWSRHSWPMTYHARHTTRQPSRPLKVSPALIVPLSSLFILLHPSTRILSPCVSEQLPYGLSSPSPWARTQNFSVKTSVSHVSQPPPRSLLNFRTSTDRPQRSTRTGTLSSPSPFSRRRASRSATLRPLPRCRSRFLSMPMPLPRYDAYALVKTIN